jgi:hypothetical protein
VKNSAALTLLDENNLSEHNSYSKMISNLSELALQSTNYYDASNENSEPTNEMDLKIEAVPNIQQKNFIALWKSVEDIVGTNNVGMENASKLNY